MKEDIKPKDGKRKLYFTIDMQNFISYNLEQKTNCEIIFEENKNIIYSKLCEINNNSKINLNNYDFFLVDLKGIKKTQNNTFTKLKLKRKIYIYNFLQNPKTILCFLLKNKVNNDLRIKNRNKILDDKTNINDNEKLLKIKNNYLMDKQNPDFYQNKSIFLYNYETNLFNTLKANLSENKLTIHGKIDKIINVKDIITDSISYSDKNPMVSSIYVSNGFRPSFYIVFKTNDEQIIMGLKNEKKKKTWEDGLRFVIDNYLFFTTNIDYNMKLNSLKNDILENETKIIEDSMIYENLLKNEEKKNIFYSIFEDEIVVKLIKDIFIFQNLIENKNYYDGILKLYEILNEINKNNKEKNKEKKSYISEIINEVQLFKYVNIYNQANDLMKKENKKQLENTLKSSLFNDSIIPFFKKKKKQYKELLERKTDVRRKIQSLLGFYFLKFYEFNIKDSFLYLNE